MPESASFPLTESQLMMWTGQKLAGELPAYNMAFTFGFEGEVDEVRFRHAFSALLSRVDVLRTIVEELDGEPRQRTLDRIEHDLELVDLSQSARSGENVDELLATWAAERARRHLRLDRPLWDSALLRLGPGRWAWYLNLHHLITDGGGCALVYRQMDELYGNGDGSPAPGSFAAWTRSDRLRKQGTRHRRARDYWRSKEAQPVDPVQLYGASAADASYGETRVSLRLGAERSERLMVLARRPEIRSVSEPFTVQSILSALLVAYLHRVSGNRHLAHAMPFHHRDTDDARRTAGLVQEMLPVFVEIDPHETFLTLIRKVMAESWSGMRHARHASSGAAYQRASEVLLNYPSISFPPFAGLPTEVRRIHPGSGDGKRLLFVQVHDFGGDGLQIDFDCNDGLFDDRLRERATRHFLRLLDRLLADPARELDRVRLLDADERRALIVDLNATARPYPALTVARMFEARAGRDPHRPALEFEGGRSTYAELNAEANRLAHHLHRLGVGPGTLVAMHAERSREAILGLLAIFKAGGAYLPLDPSYPADRLTFMLEDSKSPVLLTQRRLANALPESDLQTVFLDDIADLSDSEPATDPEPTSTLDDPAYVIYTSGSTGKPKGVVMSQRALVNLIHWQMEEATSLERPRTLQFTPLSFDVSLQETLATWCSGGTLVLIPESVRRDPTATLGFLIDNRIEQLFIIFTPLQQLAEAAQRTGLVPDSLREVITAGEQVQITSELSRLFAELPSCRLQNQYGPSETHIVTLYELGRAVEEWQRLPPIGRPIANTTLYVLDSELEPLPQGVPGELFIGGVQVGDGYLDRPGLTARKFVPDPHGSVPGARLYRSGDLARHLPSGDLEFLGRIDLQVKIRGFRVEPGEIEAELGQHPAVAKAAVVVREDQPGDHRLVGYVEPAPGAGAASDAAALPRMLRRFLQDRLPPYMVPSTIVVLGELPRTPNGKLNRRALPPPAAVRPELESAYVEPESDLESRIAAIWSDELGLESVGTADNFFDLGGHSLVLVQVHRRLQDELRVDLPVTELFRLPTIRALADRVSRGATDPAPAERIRERALRQRRALAGTGRPPDDELA